MNIFKKFLSAVLCVGLLGSAMQTKTMEKFEAIIALSTVLSEGMCLADIMRKSATAIPCFLKAIKIQKAADDCEQIYESMEFGDCQHDYNNHFVEDKLNQARRDRDKELRKAGDAVLDVACAGFAMIAFPMVSYCVLRIGRAIFK